MSFYANMELILKNQQKAAMLHQSHYHGVKFLCVSQKQSVEQRVYGHESDYLENEGREIIAIFPDARLYHSSPLGGGIAETVTIRTVDEQVRVGDQLRVIRSDKKQQRYRVESRNKIGTTTDMYFELICSGEGV